MCNGDRSERGRGGEGGGLGGLGDGLGVDFAFFEIEITWKV